VIETASWGRRIGALCIDWFASALVVMGFVGFAGWVDDPNSGFWTMLVFVLESALLIALAGGSFGQLATGLRVVRWDGVAKPVDLLRAVMRQILIALVIPPLVFRPDGRGLHDMAARTATVRLDDLRR
jgi:uncharacterized RDD family membrane protein YckC